jgi:dienelactone hydrolase
LHASPGTEFAAYVAFYPDCSYTYREDDDLVAKPLRILQGSADNYDPVGPCRAYVDRLKAKGNDAMLIEYPKANHAFDSRALASAVQLPRANNAALQDGGVGEWLAGQRPDQQAFYLR